MKSFFRVKLFFILIVFALVISITTTTIDHIRLIEQAIENNQQQLRQIEESVAYSLRTIEKAYFLFGQETEWKMENASYELIDLYERQPSFDEWDFQVLKEQLGFDIYIINEQNIITHSSFDQDIGLDFNVCCGKLVPIFDERRKSGEFFLDGIETEQATGNIKKYSYMATRDKKAIIELSHILQDEAIFQEFNFLNVAKELTEKVASINEINILNIGGKQLGQPIGARVWDPERREAFERSLSFKQTTEVRSNWQGEPAVYRYAYYYSDYDSGTSRNKVLEIVYNEHELQSLIREKQNTYVVQLFAILLFTAIVSWVVSRWVARPMYLAFHDSLTGLKNRAAFDEVLAAVLKENKGTTALMMIDLDNFKQINDSMGHDRGDQLLKVAAEQIRAVVRKRDTAIRLGGDEFVVVMPETSKEEAAELAGKLIDTIRTSAARELGESGEIITVSAGISFAPEQGKDADILLKRADIALYTAKEKGKNRVEMFTSANDTV